MPLQIKAPIIKSENVRYRFDKFGGLAWTPLGGIHKLSFHEVALLSLFEKPRAPEDIDSDFFKVDRYELISRLAGKSLLENTARPPVSIVRDDLLQIKTQVEKYHGLEINRPFWVHLQPFRFCNQECIHCYCSADSKQSKFNLPFEHWKVIVDKLSDLGVIEIYVTGGENMIVPECMDLIRYIYESGFITGLSTNGMRIPDYAYQTIKDLQIDYVQVSLDGASPETNDVVRGTPGAFEKTIKGILKLSEITIPVINMIVNKINLHEVEDMIVLGKSLGTNMFRFFPQKSCGRGANQTHLKISTEEWQQIPFEALAQRYDVEIDYLILGASCGFGTTGFAINELGDVLFCIYGIENQNLKIGNALNDDMEDLWFNSPVMNRFRNMSDIHPCSRCE